MSGQLWIAKRGFSHGRHHFNPGEVGMVVECKPDRITILRGEEKVVLSSNRTYVYLTKNNLALQDKVFVFTGALENAREFYIKLVTIKGGTVGSAVSKNVHYLVQADKDSKSTKSKKAQALGISCIGPKEFMAMLGD